MRPGCAALILSAMTQDEFDRNYPLILGWVEQTLSRYAPQARALGSLGFKRLPGYFKPEVLASAKVIYVAAVPVPPLTALGLPQFSEFEHLNAAGITYTDTFFAREELRGDEGLHFHEMVHVLQWRFLGSRAFIATYADGLERAGYRHAPLEVMAYTLETVFAKSPAPFDVAAVVREELKQLALTS